VAKGDASQRAPGGDAGSSAGWLIAIAIVIVGLALALIGEDVPAPLGRGSAAPDFTLEKLDGDAQVSLADQRGRVVLLNFWATWCKPCEDEMPAMERLYQRLQGEGFELLAVSVDDEVEVVREFRERLAISFPILMDPTQEAARAYQTAGFPESLLIDASGRIVERYVGPRAWDDAVYVRRVRDLLASR
jgi:peroxiredoxin